MQTRTNIVISATVGVAVLLIFALSGKDRGPPPAIAEERVPPAEAQHIARVIEQFKHEISARDGAGVTLRGAHPKHHGCVRAAFTVVDNLNPEHAVGLFQPGARYPAWIRFSNNADPQADDIPDVRGMAIKLLDVAGEKLRGSGSASTTHDLLLVSHPVFLFPDVATYAQAFEAFAADKAIQFFFNPFDSHIRSFLIVRKMRERHADLLDTRWWSMLPYQFGDGRAVKYSARPCKLAGTLAPENPDEDYLRTQLRRRLNRDGGCFEFMLQVQTDPAMMPIEDPTVEWDEVLSPFEPVALLTIKPQAFESHAQMQFCEDLSYNPWQALPEHRPLGGIGRARREIYSAIAKFRHTRNEVVAHEPRTLRTFDNED